MLERECDVLKDNIKTKVAVASTDTKRHTVQEHRALSTNTKHNK